MYALLNRIEKPEDVKALTVREPSSWHPELHHFIIDTVSQNGGHLAPNLGTVELTLALYSVFSFPGDKLVWDDGSTRPTPTRSSRAAGMRSRHCAG